MNNYVLISQAKSMASPYSTKSKPIISSYCRQNTIPAIFEDGKWLIESAYIQEAIQWRNSVSILDELLEEYATKNNILIANQDKRYIRQKCKSLFCNNSFSLIFVGEFFIQNNCISSVLDNIEQVITSRNTKNIGIPLAEAAKQMGLSSYQLLNQITSGKIQALTFGNEWYIDSTTLKKYLSNRNKFISVYDASVRLIKNEVTVYDPENRYHRSNLSRFLSASEYRDKLFKAEECGITPTPKHDLFYPAELADKIESKMIMFIRGYGNSADRLALIDTDPRWEALPRTVEALQRFAKNKREMGLAPLKSILLQTLKKEIIDCNDQDILEILEYAKRVNLSMANKYLSAFLNFVKMNYSCVFTADIAVNSKRKSVTSNQPTPYPFESYMAMGYMTFVPEYMTNAELIDKAIANPNYSYVWFYVAMHYVCAWRKGDIDGSLPILALPYEPQVVFEMIKNGTFTNEAKLLAVRLQSEVHNAKTYPHKTREKQQIRSLVMEIPQTLQESFGIIYAIYVCHLELDHKINRVPTEATFQKFYGEQYRRIFGAKVFLDRRANKSYLNDITGIIEKMHGINPSIMGQNIARYMRAHVPNSNAIEHYLQPKFDGLSTDEISLLLFESGTCSFIPHILHKIVYGEQYETLGPREQNSILQLSGLSAFKAENLTTLLERKFNQAQNAVSLLMRNHSVESQKLIAEQMLSNLTAKSALGKLQDVSCALAARGHSCIYPSRDCFGCPYSIPTVAFFFSALEHTRLQYDQLHSAKTSGEIRKWNSLINEETMPALYEIIVMAEGTYNMDLSKFKYELEQLIDAKGETKHVVDV